MSFAYSYDNEYDNDLILYAFGAMQITYLLTYLQRRVPLGINSVSSHHKPLLETTNLDMADLGPR